MSIHSEGPHRKVDNQSFEFNVEKAKNDPFAPDTQSLPIPSPTAVTPSKMTPDKMKVLKSHNPHLQEDGVALVANLILKLPKGES
jgi:hypothetical protein